MSSSSYSRMQIIMNLLLTTLGQCLCMSVGGRKASMRHHSNTSNTQGLNCSSTQRFRLYVHVKMSYNTVKTWTMYFNLDGVLVLWINFKIQYCCRCLQRLFSCWEKITFMTVQTHKKTDCKLTVEDLDLFIWLSNNQKWNLLLLPPSLCAVVATLTTTVCCCSNFSCYHLITYHTIILHSYICHLSLFTEELSYCHWLFSHHLLVH